jgi:TRAP-type C4-dicarboxylate transport system permease small subunit
MNRVTMDRFIDTIEWIAAFFIGVVALNIFVAVLLRNIFNYSIPDSYDFGRLLLGILIFWGIAATSYRGGHITVDLIWANVGPKYQRMIDVFATLVLLFDLRLPTWPFFAVAWIGDVSAVLLIAVRTYRLIFQPDALHQSKISPVE